jgi:hypothetical protein
MTISAISPFSASQTSNYQNYRQAFSQLANALQSGDLDGVQKALATLQQQQRAHGHHHHHHGGVSGQDSTDSSAPSGDTETVNTDVQVTATFDSTNKVDITT